MRMRELDALTKPAVEKQFGLDTPENIFKARAVAAEAWLSYFEAKIADAAEALRRLGNESGPSPELARPQRA